MTMIICIVGYIAILAVVPRQIAIRLEPDSPDRATDLEYKITNVGISGSGGAVVILLGALFIFMALFTQHECFDPPVFGRMQGLAFGALLLAIGINHYRAHWNAQRG